MNETLRTRFVNEKVCKQNFGLRARERKAFGSIRLFEKTLRISALTQPNFGSRTIFFSANAFSSLKNYSSGSLSFMLRSIKVHNKFYFKIFVIIFTFHCQLRKKSILLNLHKQPKPFCKNVIRKAL